MTERLYYTDSTLLEFKATIVSSEFSDSFYRTILDQSAFYPTSGGQLHDTGRLNNVEIVDVVENVSGEVVHISGSSVGDIGHRVSGEIDSERRRDNCQKHTAQHILSQVFVNLFEMETVSVHLGDSYASVELGGSEVTSAQLESAEHRANEIINYNLPVIVKTLDAEQVTKLPLRKIPVRSGKLRVVQIGDFDYSACGGTHCNHSSEIGLIKIIGAEKMRGNCSVRFLSGRLAFRDYCRRFAVTDSLTRRLTCHLDDLEGRIDKSFEECRLQKKEIKRLQGELAPHLADSLVSKSRPIKGVPVIVESVSIDDGKTLASLAAVIADKSGGIVLLISSDRACLTIAATCKLNAGELANQFSAKFDLKGGGGEKQAQLVGVDLARIADYRNFMAAKIDG